jgi:3-oxoacyl-[acyl-carrier-protein] synthase-3
MNLLTVGITGIGAYVPEKVVTNAELERTMPQASEEWIRTRTGILERRICADEEATSDLAVRAGQIALESAGLSSQEVDLIITATMTPDRLWPSASSTIQGRLGAVNAGAFDVNAACSGFVYALAVGAQMVRTGLYRKVLVIGVDVVSKFLDWTDHYTSVLFGDGAGAVVLEPLGDEREGIIEFVLGSDGARGDILQLPGGGSRFPPRHWATDQKLYSPIMDGYETFEFATSAMMKSVQQVLAKTRYTLADVDMIIPHQANARLINAVAKWLEVPKEKFVVNIERYGNTVAASVPLCLCEAVEQGRVKPGDLIVLTAFGAGLTWASALLRWT